LIEIKNNNFIFQTFTTYIKRTRKNPRNRKEKSLTTSKRTFGKYQEMIRKEEEKKIYSETSLSGHSSFMNNLFN
jgi:hypothetical protein